MRQLNMASLTRHNLHDSLWNSQLICKCRQGMLGYQPYTFWPQLSAVPHPLFASKTLAGGSEIELMKDSGSSSFDSKCEPSTSFDSSSTSGCSSLSGFPVLADLA
ncbi:hypothetical protein SADUNF_Sadunf01G0124700 [Salix dunnii]|uniref:Uncharacterized protein n=1 Tax=Salix dunnii TaxID=1413687 RepID=A0A835NBJ1_9ROSI|nr:hypothetical protein SADUNF_Sadunf01G0124700 [Salix dunnii]